MLNKLIKFILVLAIFTVPLFFLPFTLEQYQFNKEMLFVGLILLAGLLWIGGAVRQKKLEIVRTPLDIPILLVVLVYGLATIVADDWIASLVNFRGAGLPSFVTILSLALFYFFYVNVFAPSKTTGEQTAVPENHQGFSPINLLLGTILTSAAVVQILVFLGFFNIFLLPSQIYVTLGSYLRLVIFVALTLPLAVYFLLLRSKVGGFSIKASLKIVALGVYLFLSLLMLNTVNYSIGWRVATIGSLVFLVMVTAYYNRLTIRLNLTWVAAAVLALSLISLVLRPTSLLGSFLPDASKPKIPSEASLNRASSRQMAFDSSIGDPITFLAGKGPGNFAQVFSSERQADFNNSVVWRVRFQQAGNFVYESIATIGWLGYITFLVLLVFFMAAVVFLLMRIKPAMATVKVPATAEGRPRFAAIPLVNRFSNSPVAAGPPVEESGAIESITTASESNYIFSLIAVAAVFMGILVSLWLAVPSISTFLFLWVVFCSVGIIGIWSSPGDFSRLAFNFKDSARDALFSSLGLVFVFVMLLFFSVFIGRMYWGEYYYHQARVALAGSTTPSIAQLEKARGLIDKAIAMDQHRADYFLTDAQVNLTQVQLEVKEKGVQQVDRVKLQQLLGLAISQSNQAVDVNSQSVSTWETRGLIFESVSAFTNQARVHAILSFQRATELEPTNPILFYKLGDNQRLLWLYSQKQAVDNKEDTRTEEEITANLDLYDSALKNLAKSVDLKPSYLPPRLALARLWETQNNLAEGIKQLKEALQFSANQNNLELNYDLARLLYNQAAQQKFSDPERLKEAVSYLNAALKITPNYSNALFTRSLILKQLKEYRLAVDDMQKVADLNPGNRDIAYKLAELADLAGTSPKSALVGQVAGEQVDVSSTEEIVPEEAPAQIPIEATP